MDEIARGREAQEILNHPLIADALETIDKLISEQWQDANDPSVRESLWYTLQGSKRFRKFFEIMVEYGQIALHKQMEQENG